MCSDFDVGKKGFFAFFKKMTCALSSLEGKYGEKKRQRKRSHPPHTHTHRRKRLYTISGEICGWRQDSILKSLFYVKVGREGELMLVVHATSVRNLKRVQTASVHGMDRSPHTEDQARRVVIFRKSLHRGHGAEMGCASTARGKRSTC